VADGEVTEAGRRVSHLLDKLIVGPVALELEHDGVLQAHQGMEDLGRVDKDEGASCFLAHTSSMKRVRIILGVLG